MDSCRWLQVWDSNSQPRGYEPRELPVALLCQEKQSKAGEVYTLTARQEFSKEMALCRTLTGGYIGWPKGADIIFAYFHAIIIALDFFPQVSFFCLSCIFYPYLYLVQVLR